MALTPERMVQELNCYIDDPQWGDHSKIPKAFLRAIISALAAPTPPQSSRDAVIFSDAVSHEIRAARQAYLESSPENRIQKHDYLTNLVMGHLERAIKSTPSPTTGSELAGLAYAMQDAENACKMADLSDADRKDVFDRAGVVLKWLHVHGYEITPSPAAPTNAFDNMEGSDEYHRAHDAFMEDIRSTAPTVICTNCNGQHEPGECQRNNPTAPTITEEIINAIVAEIVVSVPANAPQVIRRAMMEKILRVRLTAALQKVKP